MSGPISGTPYAVSPELFLMKFEAIVRELFRASGGELEQVQMLLGHASVQTTERYLGTKQDLMHAPNDAIKLRVNA